MKPKPKPTSTKSHWDELDEMLGLASEPMGPEWFTTEQFAEHRGSSIETARRFLKKDKRIELWRGIIAVTGRNGYKYRIKPKK